jgi:hypothetical protein
MNAAIGTNVATLGANSGDDDSYEYPESNYHKQAECEFKEKCQSATKSDIKCSTTRHCNCEVNKLFKLKENG